MSSERRRTVLAAVGSMFFTGCLSEISSTTDRREGLLEAVPYGEKLPTASTTAYGRIENPYYRTAVARTCETNSSAHITIPPSDVGEAKDTAGNLPGYSPPPNSSYGSGNYIECQSRKRYVKVMLQLLN